jgi:hypothetical protein
MKTIILIVLVAFSSISCQKEKAATCEITMENIAGSYKETKFESVSYTTGVATDLTSTLSGCELSGIYTFKIDGTATYTELVNCAGNGNGTWETPGTWMYTLFSSGTGNRISGTLIENWDCSNLVLITRFPSVAHNYRITLSRL